MNLGRQRGFALLLILLVIVTVGSTLLFTGPLRLGTDPEEQAVIGSDLVEGRSGLTVYAAWGGVSSGRPGTVPCPDMSEPGEPGYGQMHNFSCNSSDEVFIGRLPWKTLDMRPAPQPVWLAVDGFFVNDPDNEPVNPTNDNLTGLLRLNGESGYAAVVLAPGDPLEGQTGRPSSAISDYLEGHNRDGHDGEAGPTPQFENCGAMDSVSRLDDEPCNDRAIGIRASRILELGGLRALAEVEEIIRNYNAPPGEGELPYPAGMNTGPQFHCDEAQSSGRLPLSASTEEEGCQGYFDVCEMDAQWIRPLEEDIGEYDCEPENDFENDDESEPFSGGNDWLRLVHYRPDSTCFTPGGPCSVTLSFEIQEAIDEEIEQVFADMTREVVLESPGGGE